jgi:hypothetical protein
MKPSLIKTVERNQENVNRISKIATPVFNTPAIPFKSLPLIKDSQGRLMEMEFIALPGTLFRCAESISENIVRVEIPDYPSTIPLYTDSRFLHQASPREKSLPSSQTILDEMENCRGIRYFWGGNWKTGIPDLLEFYPHLKEASAADQDDAICRGLDCSGLLYQAAHGMTPRNTSELIHFGQELSLHHLPLDQIQAQLRPLDLLAWRGHVVIVRSPTTLIESRINHGVVVTHFEDRFPEILQLLKEQNKTLYFRRWHPDTLKPH